VLLDLLAAGRLVADVGLEAPWSELGAPRRAASVHRERAPMSRAILESP
jgi:hypothetical protein